MTSHVPCGDKCFESCTYPFCEVNRRKEGKEP